MKMKLGSREIQLNRVSKVTRAGKHIAEIHFVTGESIHVICGIQVPNGASISYPGTCEELKSFIERHKEPN